MTCFHTLSYLSRSLSLFASFASDCHYHRCRYHSSYNHSHTVLSISTALHLELHAVLLISLCLSIHLYSLPFSQILYTSPHAIPSSPPSTSPACPMCIPQIDIIRTSPPKHHNRERRIPLSAECTNAATKTSYVSISPRIIYRSPPSRSSLPRTHRPDASRRESTSLEVEVSGGFIAEREAPVREKEPDKEKEWKREGEKCKEPAIPAPPTAPVPASASLTQPHHSPRSSPIPPPPPPSPPKSPPQTHHHPSPSLPLTPHPRPRHHFPSPSSSSSSASSHSSLLALKRRMDLLFRRVDDLEQWRARELGRRRDRGRNWERVRKGGR